MIGQRVRRTRDLARFLYVQRLRGFDPPTEPHFDPETLRFLEEALAKATLYLGFGSGGGTILANKLGIPTISVKGDRFYAEAVRSALSQNTSVQIITPNMGITGEWSMALFRARYKCARYARAPFALLKDSSLDLVLIDGRYRVSCALQTARRAFLASTKTTFIFDDYLNRPPYHVTETFLGKPKKLGRAEVFRVDPQNVETSLVSPFVSDPI